jgi:hypothetical protein
VREVAGRVCGGYVGDVISRGCVGDVISGGCVGDVVSGGCVRAVKGHAAAVVRIREVAKCAVVVVAGVVRPLCHRGRRGRICRRS